MCRSLSAGKHVFVEKPLCLNRDELDRIRDLVAELGPDRPVLTVGYNRRFSPHTAAIQQAFASRTSPMVVQYRINAGRLPLDTWPQDPGEGGGRVVGEVCHFVDWCRAVIGHPVREVSAAAAVFADATQNADDALGVHLRYADGSLASLVYLSEGSHELPKEAIEVHAGGRSATLDDFRESRFHGTSQRARRGTQQKGVAGGSPRVRCRHSRGLRSDSGRRAVRDLGRHPSRHRPTSRNVELRHPRACAVKILFLTHYFPPEGNAPATRVYEFAKRWVAEGHEVTVITCAPNVPSGKVYAGYKNRFRTWEDVDGIRVLRVWTFLAANAGSVRRIANYVSYMLAATLAGLLLRRPSIVIATSPQMFCGIAGAILKIVKRCPFVLEIRDIWPESIAAVGAMRRSRLFVVLEKLERWMYRRATHIVTVGPGYRRKLLQRGVPDDRITVVPNGVDTDRPPTNTPDPEVRRNLHNPRAFLAGYVGTVGMAAGLEVLVSVASQLRKDGDTSIEILVVGDGADRANLAAQARSLNLTNITFTGRVDKRAIPGVYCALDACITHLPRHATVRDSISVQNARSRGFGSAPDHRRTWRRRAIRAPFRIRNRHSTPIMLLRCSRQFG